MPRMKPLAPADAGGDVLRYVVGLASADEAERVEASAGKDGELASQIRVMKQLIGVPESPTATAAGAVDDAYATVRAEARDRAEQRLTNLLAEVRERFQANYAWLFVPEAGGRLRAVVTQGTGRRHLELPARESGIVAYVAQAGGWHCTGQVRSDPLYRAGPADTASEAAVAVTAADGRVLGVINLESRRPAAFDPVQIAALQTAAVTFVPHLLVLADDGACPWHPEVHGWDLTDLAGRFCHAVAGAYNRRAAADTATCTVWYADHDKDELFVYATSGYDLEYQAERTLPMDSFVGRVARYRRGPAVLTTPAAAEGFRNRAKAEATGLEWVVAAPVPSPAATGRRGVAVLTLYFFSPDPAGPRAAKREMPALAIDLGRLIGRHRTARREMAAAHLRRELVARSRSSDAGFETVKAVLADVLAADGVSLFARPAHQNRLYCVTTTGLEFAPPPAAGEPNEGAVYDLNTDRGFTSYLAGRGGVCVRKNDTMNADERGVPDDFPPKPLNKHRERFARSEIDRRRFLGVGVALGGTDTLGVVRLNRAANTRPFTHCDQELLAALADDGACKQAFLDWRAKAPHPRDTVPPEAEAARLLLPVPVLSSPQTLADELVQELVLLLRRFGVRHAGVAFVPRTADRPQVRWYAYHSEQHRTPPDDGLFLPDGADGWRAALASAERKVVTFDGRGTGVLGRGAETVAEVWVPLLGWSGTHLLSGLLSVGFGKPVGWADFDFGRLVDASRKLTAILGGTDQVIHPDCFLLPTLSALRRFAAYPITHRAIAAEQCQLVFRDPSGERVRVRQERRKDGPKERANGPAGGSPAGRWASIRSHLAEEVNAFGAGLLPDRRTWRVPLRVGPFDVGELRCRFPTVRHEAQRDELMRTVPGLWSRFSFGIEKFWEWRFAPGRARGGVTVWEQVITLPQLSAERECPTADEPGLVAAL